MRSTRRGLLRAAGTAVVAVPPAVVGIAGEGLASDLQSDPEETCEPQDDGYPPLEGFVFFPETYRGCTPFRILAFSRSFWTSVGRGPTACQRERREYVAYGISYADVEGAETGLGNGSGSALEEQMSTFLAVETQDETQETQEWWTETARPQTATQAETQTQEGTEGTRTQTPTETPEPGTQETATPAQTEENPPLPHEYFVSGQRFQFVSTDGEFVFHTRCSEPPTPVQGVTFATVS